ncbi:uncharacterized protein LOC115891612 [Sitophilus oryzae]|uniref:Uncharacterized protein LOC115891612 n=1 Tax=Sitophilus oryzae TaxID=7048 RepID=A0A6J2YXK6_SITOR|nr:uncharacterized protein LOC115891612 [Sitophilus oryzae]
MKYILKALAIYYQSRNLASEEAPRETESYELRPLLNTSVSTNIFTDSDKDNLDTVVTSLEVDGGKIFTAGFLVNSVGFPVRNKENAHLKFWSDTAVPPVYDALLYIFICTTEEFRQRHFSELLQVYFQQLTTSIENYFPEHSSKLTTYYRETSLRVLLPIVKFQIVINSQAPEDLILNTSRFLKNPLINQEDIYDIVENKFHSKEYKLDHYYMKKLDTKNGHLGQYFNLTIKITRKGESNTLHLFVKVIIPHTEFLRDTVESGPAEKEHFFYYTLLPLYEEHGLKDILDFAPQCFLSRAKWLIVLEDLAKAGFRGMEVNQNLDFNKLKAVVSLLAKIAASTLILEENLSRSNGKRVRMDELYPEKFKETIYIDDKETQIGKIFNGTKDAIHYILDLCPEITAKCNLTQDEIYRRTDEMYESLFKKILTSEKFRNVMNHGDMHLGNMLFHFDENDAVFKAILVDFQILRYIPPVFELLFFIYSCSSRDTRLKYIDQLVEEYYQDISKYLRDFHYDPEEVFPRDEFIESIKYIKSAVLSATCMIVHMAKLQPKIREDVFFNPEKFDYYVNKNKRALIDLVWNDEYYNKCMKDMVRDIMDFIAEYH